MAANESSALSSPASAHQVFHWIDGPSKHSAYASFVELTYDIAAGIHTCLEIVHASDLQREINQTAEEGEAQLPAVSAFDAEKLLRLAMASSSLLTQKALQCIEAENAMTPEALAAAANV